MVEGFSTSLDWFLQFNFLNTPSRTLGINCDPCGECLKKKDDIKKHVEDKETFKMDENKEALITEN